jgi:tetratricopeptide (TPR) repeat protein
MNKYLTVFLLICSPLFIIKAQDLQTIDSLTKSVPIARGKEKILLLNSLAWEYRLIIPDSTISIGKRSYELGKKLQLETGQAIPLNFIGVAYEYKGSSIEAYEYYKQALTEATNQNDIVQVAYASNNLGRLFLDQGNILKSLEAHNKALQIFESMNDLRGMEFVHLNLAQLYLSQQNFKLAEQYFLKVHENRLKLDRGPSVSSFINLGTFYRQIGEMGKSNQFFFKADSLCSAIGNQVQRTEVNFLLAENSFLENKLNTGERFAEKALASASLRGQNNARIYNILGKIYFKQNKLGLAKECFKKVLDNARTFKSIELKMDAHYYLFQIFNKEGSTENKLTNQNQYLSLKDSVNELELTRQIEKLKFQFNLEIEQKKRENELLKTLDARNTVIIKKQQTINTIYGVALVVIIIIAFLQFRNAKIKSQLNVELEKKQEKIIRQSEELKAINLEIEKINANLEKIIEERTRTIKEKNKLLREYAYFNSHQIRGPLARILGLISLVNMEYKDNFGPHLQMLQQAGNDLDDAINTINKLIDDVGSE